MTSGIHSLGLADTPLAVVDTETTGLYPGGDRIIEIAVVRVAPRQEPVVTVDTLVNPCRPVAATEIHGITDADVDGAPTFAEVAPLIVDALKGAVFASYNVYFDAKFVREELRRAGLTQFPAHLCLMYLRPMLGLGRKCSLRDACDDTGVEHTRAHTAAADAMAAARLWGRYLDACERAGVRTFRQLADLRSYKFTGSFDDGVLIESMGAGQAALVRQKARGQSVASTRAPDATTTIDSRQQVLADYWEALTAAMADLDVSPFEVFYLKAKRDALGLRPEELRWLHARAFSGVLASMCQDRAITDTEAAALSGVASALRELGWAPGD